MCTHYLHETQHADNVFLPPSICELECQPCFFNNYSLSDGDSVSESYSWIFHGNSEKMAAKSGESGLSIGRWE